MNDFNQNPNVNQPQDNEDLDTVLKVVSFCIPLVGAVLYFINKDKAPRKAKSACNMALIGVGVVVVLNIISYLMGWNAMGAQ